MTNRALARYSVPLAAVALLGWSHLSALRAQTETPNVLQVPAKSVPVPTTVSPQLQKIIGMPLRTNWDVLPKTGEEFKPVADAGAAATIKNLPGMMDRLRVKVEKTTIDGVRAFVVTPDVIAPENANRVLLHVHGGCYVLNPGEAGLPEALGLKKKIAVVKGCRDVQKTDLIHNDYLPDIDVDPQTYQVKADGVLLWCEPADVLPMAQRYFLF